MYLFLSYLVASLIWMASDFASLTFLMLSCIHLHENCEVTVLKYGNLRIFACFLIDFSFLVDLHLLLLVRSGMHIKEFLQAINEPDVLLQYFFHLKKQHTWKVSSC